MRWIKAWGGRWVGQRNSIRLTDQRSPLKEAACEPSAKALRQKQILRGCSIGSEGRMAGACVFCMSHRQNCASGFQARNVSVLLSLSHPQTHWGQSPADSSKLPRCVSSFSSLLSSLFLVSLTKILHSFSCFPLLSSKAAWVISWSYSSATAQNPQWLPVTIGWSPNLSVFLCKPPLSDPHLLSWACLPTLCLNSIVRRPFFWGWSIAPLLKCKWNENWSHNLPWLFQKALGKQMFLKPALQDGSKLDQNGIKWRGRRQEVR